MAGTSFMEKTKKTSLNHMVLVLSLSIWSPDSGPSDQINHENPMCICVIEMNALFLPK